MHRAIAAWLTEHPWRAAVGSALCGALALQMPLPFMILAGGIPVLVALRSDAKFALGIAATGAAAAAWIVFLMGQPELWLLASIALLFFSPTLLALLLKRTGSLNLCFQVAVLGATAALLAIHVVLPDPAGIWLNLLRAVLKSLVQAGVSFPGNLEEIARSWSRTMWGALVALALAMIMGGVLMGRWWQTLLQSPGAFGNEYRRLRLGLVLGLMITVVFIMAYLSKGPLVSSLTWVAFVALAFQGLAAAHRSKAGGRLNRGWLAAIYVLLIVPLSTSITVFVLAIWGFADNWLRPRAQFN